MKNPFTKPQTLEELATRELELREKRSTVTAALVDAERTAGEAYLTGDDGKAEIADVTRLKVQTDAIGRAIATLRTMRGEVITAKFQREAVALRKQASERKSELTKLQDKLDSLMAQIAELEGTPVVIAGLNEFGQKARRSHELTDQISSIEQRAADFENKQVPTYGFIDLQSATTDDEVVRAVLLHESAAPDAQQISDWLAGCQAAAINQPFADLPRRVRLEWKDGEIDKTASYVFVPSLAPRRMSQISDGQVPAGYDSAAATFKVSAA